MRVWGRLLFAVAVAALCCVLMPGLIHTSQAEAGEEERGPVPVSAGLSCVADVPAAQPGAVPREQSREHGQAAVFAVQTETAPRLVLCDGNGWPLTGRTWVR